MKSFITSFKNALRGFVTAYREEPNLRTHFIVAVLILLLSAYLKITTFELFFVILAICLVIIAEVINSIFERMLDMLKPGINEYVKDMKDMMASVVVIAVVFAIVVGGVIFIPKILIIFN